MSVAHVGQNEFADKITNSALPVLVDFYADWCGPCRALAPVIEELAQEYAGRLNVFKINVDEAPEVAAKYNIRSIPTMIIFKAGKDVERVAGALPRQEIARYLERLAL
jgi:thioredoxin 1